MTSPPASEDLALAVWGAVLFATYGFLMLAIGVAIGYAAARRWAVTIERP